jgi:hypothetical protein
MAGHQDCVPTSLAVHPDLEIERRPSSGKTQNERV